MGEGRAAQFGFGGAVVDLGPDLVGGHQQLKNAGAPGVTGLTTDLTARAVASGAALAHQALGQHAQERGAEQKRLHAHVDQAVHGAGRVVGVQCGQHQVAGERSLDRDLCGLKVADLADHDHVRVLPQDGPQGFGKGQVDLGIHLRLAHARQLVFDGVFHRHDVVARGVQALQRGVQAGGFA